MEEENEYQEDISTEENEEGCNEICSVCKSGGSVFRCDECDNWLHESCAQSTILFLCKFCLTKKQLGERESESNDSLGREDSNSEADQRNKEYKQFIVLGQQVV